MPCHWDFCLKHASESKQKKTLTDSELPLPWMGRLFQEGTTFTKTYTTPKCAPSRTNILTGRYCSRSEWSKTSSLKALGPTVDVVDVNVPNCVLGGDDLVNNLPRVLKKAGYTTGAFGKW